jgi:hypothetical protein
MTKIALIAAAVQAVLGALVLLGVINLTDEQLAGIMTAVNAVMVAVASWFSPAIPWYGVSEK